MDGWLTLVFEYVDGRHPDLSPRSPDIPMVLEKITMLIDVLPPSPFAGAAAISDHRAYRAAPAELLAGDTLLHCSPRPDNLIINSE
ncbi:aminoglycoside phosphotransferase, partial [Kitasatospora sp. NPDC093558]